MGPQFAHMQAFSIKPNRQGNSIEQVLAEAIREAKFSTHIDDPKPPTIIYGVDLPTLKTLHDEMLDQRKVEVKIKGKVRYRAIRKDRNTLMTVISSFPVRIADLDKDGTGETRRLYEKWKKLNTNHLKNLFGDKLKTVIEHTDEEYPHLHAYILPDDDPGAFANALHPGEVAKADAAKKAKSEGLTGEAINKVANKGYQAAMSGWQDDFYEAVGAPCALTRDGPKRTRKTRARWQAEKIAARATADVIEKNQTETKALELEARALRTQSDTLDDAEDENEAARKEIEEDRAIIARDRQKLNEDRKRLNADRAKFKKTIDKVKDGIQRIFDVVADKLGVSIAGVPRVLEAMKILIDAADDLDAVEPDDEPSL
ncbi:plasmid recombination protein [Octadecabacter sp. 1_MG-2023]|uniref:plasmid recombination protein n=1 Tax=unclassified Octadecabacter TaxID=196158 RepID=UPI001C088B6C|nr:MULTISPECIES: plasmid recombination protein [unclassified Octadecabacter]MBU2993946.1 plasmid recombination protein [Octadecabacter sp. B2R22]MDO6735208.1 plasmid recombination protein [Octadecabacter sp. 1_MG-2023]